MKIYKDDDDNFVNEAKEAIDDGNTLILLARGNRDCATVHFNNDEYDSVDELLDDIQCDSYGGDFILFMNNPTIRECRKLDPLIEGYDMRVVIAAREDNIREILCNVDDSGEVIVGLFGFDDLYNHNIKRWIEM